MKQTLKQTMALILSVVMLILTVPMVNASNNQVSISASSTTVNATKEVTFTVSVMGTDSATSAFVDVDFPDTLELVEGKWLKTGVMSDYNTTKNEGIFALSQAGDFNGDLFKLTLKSKDVNAQNQAISINVQIKNDGTPVLNETGTTTVNIEKRDFGNITFNGNECEYDGTEKKLEISGTLPEGAKVDYTNEKGTNAGTYNATAKITGAGYNDKTLNATLTINPKELTIKDLTAKNKTYDGTVNATLSGGTLLGAVKGDDVSATIPTEGKFADENVGNNKAVKINTISLSGTEKANYTLTQPTDLKANIIPAEISIKAKDKSMKVGGTLPTFDYETIGTLFGDDAITGSLKTTTDGKTKGTFDIVEDEKFTAGTGNNYNVTFTKGTLTVSEKDNQNVTVSDIPTSKTYGDAPFTFTITDNETNVTGNITVTSSNPDVATVSNDSGTVTVTIKKAGTTEIRVFRAGNDTYADFDEKTTLAVGKKTLKIKAKSDTVKQSDTLPLPKLDSTWWLLDESTSLAPDDTVENTISGALAYAENATRKTIGTYAIKQGNLSVGDNYVIDFTEGTITVEPKTEQTITITGLETKTYGDTDFSISATSTSGLTDFTYTSSDTNVATIDTNGNITIKGAGKTDINVTQAGNDEYAAKTETKELVVNKKDITVTSVDIANKTAVLNGVLETDKETAVLDFDKITLTIGDAVDETTSNAVLTNFVLKGDKAGNYNITTESLNTTVANENVVTVTITAENGTVTGAAKYLKGAEVTVNATPDSGYKFDGWYNGDTSVSTSASYTFKAESDISLVAKFSRKSTGGGGGGGNSVSTYTVKFETSGGSTIDSVKVDKNKTVTEPTAPTKDGFEFAGWYADKALTTKYDFDTKVTKGITLYAAWTERKAEIKDDNTEPTEPTTPENKITFTDVKENDWFAENVKYVFENGLMNGTTETEFAPNKNLTRAMLVTILYRAAGEPETNKSVPFADVTADSYYANAVIWAQQNGIVSGVTENEFAPDENITREQIATIIYRYANFKGYDTSAKADISSFTDADEISDYATEAMQYAVASGLIKGKTETTLNPQDNATRAEIAAILQRFIEGNK